VPKRRGGEAGDRKEIKVGEAKPCLGGEELKAGEPGGTGTIGKNQANRNGGGETGGSFTIRRKRGRRTDSKNGVRESSSTVERGRKKSSTYGQQHSAWERGVDGVLWGVGAG